MTKPIHRFEEMGLHVPTLLFPPDPSDQRWPCVACDQYTSQEEVWQAMDRQVGDASSTLRLVLPEVYLKQTAERLPQILGAMEGYIQRVLTRQVHGFILTRRTTQSGARLGLVACVDLEQYDFSPDSSSLIRATEGTIIERLPPRIQVRKDAPLECSHILLLANDRQNLLLEPLYLQLKDTSPYYDLDLMANGGHLTGWAVTGELLLQVEQAFSQLFDQRGDAPFLAVGDGNHSLATAKAIWDELAPQLAGGDHPARYALCEITNLFDDALVFEPIHRVLFGGGDALSDLLADVPSRPATQAERPGKNEALVATENGARIYGPLPLRSLQERLDALLQDRPGLEIDYIHGDDTALSLGTKPGNAAILLPPMEKLDLFSLIKDGPLPRKAFSMGEANEKRYYMECRKIK